MCGNVVPGTLIAEPSILGASPGCGIDVACNAFVYRKGFAFCEVREIDADNVDLWPDACRRIPNGKITIGRGVRGTRGLAKGLPKARRRSLVVAVATGRTPSFEEPAGLP